MEHLPLFPYRRFGVALADDRARLRVDAGATPYSLIVSDLHRLLLAGLSGELRKNLDTSGAPRGPSELRCRHHVGACANRTAPNV
jgi:hypothetical protein